MSLKAVSVTQLHDDTQNPKKKLNYNSRSSPLKNMRLEQS